MHRVIAGSVVIALGAILLMRELDSQRALWTRDAKSGRPIVHPFLTNRRWLISYLSVWILLAAVPIFGYCFGRMMVILSTALVIAV